MFLPPQTAVLTSEATSPDTHARTYTNTTMETEMRLCYLDVLTPAVLFPTTRFLRVLTAVWITCISYVVCICRDLKPSNIGLCGQGHVKLFDLGLSVVRPLAGAASTTYEVRDGERRERAGKGKRKMA